MDADFVLGQGDRAPVLTATLNDEDDEPVDLTGATAVTMEISNEDEAEGPRIETVTVLDPVAATVQYDWVAADTATPGRYDIRINAVLASGKTMSWPNDRCWKLLVTPKPGNG